MDHERHHGHLSPSQIAKREVVEQIKEKIQNSESFVIIDYKGLTVAQDTEFRAEFRKNDVEYKVLKNTLFKKALNELGYTEFDEALNGPSAFAFGTSDAIQKTRVIAVYFIGIKARTIISPCFLVRL